MSIPASGASTVSIVRRSAYCQAAILIGAGGTVDPVCPGSGLQAVSRYARKLKNKIAGTILKKTLGQVSIRVVFGLPGFLNISDIGASQMLLSIMKVLRE
jgi:hypothetical protein